MCALAGPEPAGTMVAGERCTAFSRAVRTHLGSVRPRLVLDFAIIIAGRHLPGYALGPMACSGTRHTMRDCARPAVPSPVNLLPTTVFSLTLLDGSLLEGPNGPVRGRAGHRCRIALLARWPRLANGRSRVRGLIGLLWPEHPGDAARHLLSESLYVLRKAIGDDAFVAVDDEVALNLAVVESERPWSGWPSAMRRRTTT